MISRSVILPAVVAVMCLVGLAAAQDTQLKGDAANLVAQYDKDTVAAKAEYEAKAAKLQAGLISDLQKLLGSMKGDDPQIDPIKAKIKELKAGAPAPAMTPTAAATSTAAVPAGGQTKELSLDLGGGAAMKLVLIPSGKFVMGEGAAMHEVTISKPFYMGVTEVTQAQYEAVMGTNWSKFKGAANPVEQVSWNEATEFCKKLSEKTHQAVRLPTEAEWEYACRAGNETEVSFGDTKGYLNDYGWDTHNSDAKTHPVGKKKPNAWGLYDMHGNVWEWCADWRGEYPKGPVTDPQGPASGDHRVYRGGSFDTDTFNCGSGYRNAQSPDARFKDIGFRVVVGVSAP